MANIIHGADISTKTRLNMKLALNEYLLKVTENHSNNILMIDAETAQGITCGEVLRASDRMAKFLSNLGIEKGDVVAIASENRFEFLPGLLAALRIGSVFTCVNPLYTIGELGHAFAISKPIAVMVTNRTYDKVNTVRQSCDYIKHVINLDILDFLKESNTIDDNEIGPSVPVDPAETALILYSSGTTGLSKGVQLTHRSIICLMEAYRTEKILPFPDGNTISGLLSMSHTYGLFCILSCFVLGHKYIMIGRYSEESFLRYIEKHKITTLYVVPSIVLFLSKSSLVDNYNLSSVKLISSGGGPIRKSVEETIKNRFNCDMIQNYGMTETTTMNLISLPSSRPGTTGRLLPGMMAKIIDLKTGNPLGPGEFGEYCIKGPLLMKQYCDTDATGRMESFDNEGWLHSGDVAYYDEEYNFYIVDRVKELIKYKGYQVPPAEIEGLLLQLSAIESVGVVGVPDEEAGELPRAYVVKQKGSEITAEDIQEYVAENLAPFKKLRGGVIFVDELPRTVSGKVERKELKKWVT